MDNNSATAPEPTVLSGLVFVAVLAALGFIVAPDFVTGLAVYAYSHLFDTFAAILGGLVDSALWLGSLASIG
jgi:hypothetical protein